MATRFAKSAASRTPDLATLMRRDTNLAGLLPTARAITELNTVFRHTVPPALGNAARVVALRTLEDGEGGGTMHQVTFHAHYPAVAAKLKQLEPRLIEAFENTNHGGIRGRAGKITGIKIQVQPPEEPIAERLSDVMPLKDNTRAVLQGVAERIPDSVLKERLRQF